MRPIEKTRAGSRWAAALAAFAAGLAVEELVVYPLLISPRLPDVWEMSWALRVAYLGPEVFACLLGGAMLPSRRALLLFGFGSAAIRATLHAVQTARGAEGYLQARETLALALPVMLVTMTIVYAALAAVGRAIGARAPRRSGP